MSERFWVKLDRNRFYREMMNANANGNAIEFAMELASHLFLGQGNSEWAAEMLEEAGIEHDRRKNAGIHGAEKRWRSNANGNANGKRHGKNRTVQNSTEEEQKKDSLPGAKAPRPRNPLFDALADAFFVGKIAKADGSRIGKQAAILAERGATPEQVAAKKAAYIRMHPEWDCTMEAVVKHWPNLSDSPRTVQPVSPHAHLPTIR